MKIKDIITVTVVTLSAAACSSDIGEQRAEELVPIRLSAEIDASETRTATTSTTQDTELLENQNVSVYVKDYTGTFLSNGNPMSCTVANDGSLTPASTVYYPMDGTPATIYAVHPSHTSGEPFVVSTDQTDADNYAVSDLTYCKTASYNRSLSVHTLTFKHLMSKLIINVETTVGEVSNLRVWAKKSATMTYPTGEGDDYTLGTATSFDNIKMVNGGAVIIPPQTTALEGDVTILFDVAGNGTVHYKFPASTVFEANTQYSFTVKYGTTLSVTSSVSAWGYDAAGTLANADQTFNKTVQIGRPKLPIEYVADYNMKTATTFATSDEPSQTAYFTWNVPANLNAFKNGTAVKGYHLPSKREWCTIIPPYRAYNSTTPPDTDIDNPEGPRIGPSCGKKINMGEYMSWGVKNINGTYTYEVSQKFYNDYNSIDDPAHERIYYALRFREKDGSTYKNGLYTCAYRYQYFYDETNNANSYLVIKVKYVGFNQIIDIDAISDEDWWLTSDFSKSFSVTGCYGWDGVFYPAGSYGASSDKFKEPLRMYYWSCSSINADSHWATIIGPNIFMAGEGGDKLYSFAVRLFKDAGTP